MKTIESKIKKWGHSLGMIIPKKTVDEMNLKENERIKIEIIKKEKINAFGICKNTKSFKREEGILDRW